jgi:hypothetical protein
LDDFRGALERKLIKIITKETGIRDCKTQVLSGTSPIKEVVSRI